MAFVEKKCSSKHLHTSHVSAHTHTRTVKYKTSCTDTSGHLSLALLPVHTHKKTNAENSTV